MKLRFEVDQADCFRHGIDCPKSVVTIEVKPADLTQEKRDLIADRMDGIDVCKKGWKMSAITTPGQTPRIIAKRPTFDSLIAAIEIDEQKGTEVRKN